MARFHRATGNTDGLEIVRKRRGAGARDSEEAEAWARTQPWHGRVVTRKQSLTWWCWFLQPENT